MPLMLFAACQTTLNRADVECASFVPERWREPVASAPLPNFTEADQAFQKAETAEEMIDRLTFRIEGLEAEAKAWQGFGVGQTGQLAIANGRAADERHIRDECERRFNEAKPRTKILGIF